MSSKRRAAPVEVFISHSSKNLAFATRLTSVLTAHRIKSFLSEKSIRGAQKWHDEIGSGLKRCNWFLLILSPESVRSKWVKQELTYALDANRYDKRIIPILYKACKTESLSWTLPTLQYIDFRTDFDKGCRELLAIWKISYKI